MNTNELTPLITQPSATTRRSFIKRTASAAMVAMFALGAFENEALATEGGNSSEWIIVYNSSSFDYQSIINPDGTMIRLDLNKIESEKIEIVDGHTVTITIEATPGELSIPYTTFKDGTQKLVKSSLGFSSKAKVKVKDGATLMNNAEITDAGTLSADWHEVYGKPYLMGDATPDDGAQIDVSANAAPELSVKLKSVANSGNGLAYSQSAAPSVALTAEIWIKTAGNPGWKILTHTMTVSASYSAYKVPQ